MLGDDDSVVAVVVLPALAGGLGYLVAGPLGFFAGAVLVLVVGAMVDYEGENESERIAELEARVAELEAELRAERESDSGGSGEA